MFGMFRDEAGSRSTWYHRLDSPTSNVPPNKTLIINAAQRIWSELYMKKKPVRERDDVLFDLITGVCFFQALEEILKMSFSQLATQNKTTLVEVR